MVEELKKAGKTLIGTVVSDKMDKTVVVKVTRSYVHPRVEKVVRADKKYSVHDEAEVAREGDIVEIYEGRPVSKTKYMYLLRVVESAFVATK
jgi:small subunit ribosomal protein S17